MNRRGMKTTGFSDTGHDFFGINIGKPKRFHVGLTLLTLVVVSLGCSKNGPEGEMAGGVEISKLKSKYAHLLVSVNLSWTPPQMFHFLA